MIIVSSTIADRSADPADCVGTVADCTPGSQCVPVLSIEKIWIMAGRFGCTMRCQALICHPRKEASLEELFCMEPLAAEPSLVPCPAG